jgi:hypothetical protein
MKRLLAVAALAVVSLASAAQTTPPSVRLGTSEQSSPASPVDPAKLAKVEKLFAVMHIERTMDQMMGMMQQMIVQSFKSSPGMDAMTPEQQKLVADYQKRAMALANETMGWKAMEPEYAKIYAAEFSEAEIDAVTTFYGSPAGQALLDKTPEIGQQTMKVVQERMVTLQPRMREMSEEFLRQLKETTPAAPKSTAPKTPAKTSPSSGK